MFSNETKTWDLMESMVHERRSARSLQTKDGSFYMTGTVLGSFEASE